MSMLRQNPALAAILDASEDLLAAAEGLAPDDIVRRLEAGTMVLLANPGHAGVLPTLIGQPAAIKVNANIGTSPMNCDVAAELAKLRVCEDAGAHAVMDLSTAGDLDAVRQSILAATRLPLGTVPIYGLAQALMAAEADPADFAPEDLLAEIDKQARQGVDFMTLHAGVTRRAATMAAEAGGRVMGIVSRGGSILARWMARRGEENPLLTRFDDVLDICRAHNVTISLGDGLRPGAGPDAGDRAQMEEVIVLGELTKRCRQAGVQAMIEGPGHVPLHLVQSQIQAIKRLTDGAPLYVLGPLVTDSAPGHDHIGAAIGGALAGQYGADFLCYVTPAEHLALPDAGDVRQGVKASLIAAHATELALGRPRAVARDLAMSQARKDLDWETMADLSLDPELVRDRRARSGAAKEDRECAMCGKFCAVKMLENL